VKILAEMNISETRVPQDGRILFDAGKRKKVDMRVSTFPTVHGETIVCRVLDKQNADRRPGPLRHAKRDARAVQARHHAAATASSW
jgi:type II secretory ATPase GspE/PulE/Tfp pilus assembly ATPase PilB-like protein